MFSIKKKIKSKVQERRINELAWLLECSSMCTATSVINGKFYISANEFFNGTEPRNNNKQLHNVCSIMEYFKEIANGSIGWREVKTKRDSLMRTICKNQISTASLGRTVIPDEIITAIVCTDVLARAKLPSQLAPGLKTYIKKNKGFAYQALGYGLDIYKRFLKIEQSIRKALKGDFTEFSEEQLTAFKSFSYNDSDKSTGNIVFLENDNGKDVHAEAQILNQIIDLIVSEAELSKEIYIGISKRCCMNCHCLLDTANEILKEYGYLIKFSGAHDTKFEDNWGRPPILKQAELERIGRTRSGTEANKAKELSLNGKIREKYLKKIATIKFKTNQPVQRYSIRHSPSSSEVSSLIDVEIYKQELIDDLGVLKKRGAGSTEQAQLLRLGIVLCSLDRFTELFEMMPGKVTRKGAIIGNILTDFNLKYSPNINMEQLNKFLCNSNFAGVKIYDYFKDLSVSKKIKEPCLESTENLQSILNLLSENREQYRQIIQKQQELLSDFSDKLSDYEIFTQYENSTEPKTVELYKVTQSLVSLNENLISLQNKLFTLNVEVQKEIFVSAKQKHIVHLGQKIHGKVEKIIGDGWCALRATGFDKPKEIVEDLKLYHADSDPKNIKHYIINCLSRSIYNNYHAAFGLKDQQIALEGKDCSGNNIAEKMRELYLALQSKEGIKLNEDSKEFREFFAYIGTKEVQQAYLDYIIRNSYADYNVILACLALEGKNRKVGLLIDYANQDGRLADLSDEEINLEDANCTCVIYQPNLNPLLAHYDRFILNPLLLAENIDEVGKKNSDSLSKASFLTPAFQLKKDSIKRPFDNNDPSIPISKLKRKKKESYYSYKGHGNDSAKRWIMKPQVE